MSLSGEVGRPGRYCFLDIFNHFERLLECDLKDEEAGLIRAWSENRARWRLNF